MAGGRSSDITNLKKAGINFVFNEAAKVPMPQQWPQIVTKVMEEKAVGTYMTAGDIGNASLHTEGSAYTFEGRAEDWKTEITIQIYGKGVYATRKQMKDDQSNFIANTFGAPLVQAMVQKKEQVVADVYNDGFATSMADGVYVFSNTHPLSNAPALYNDNLVTGAITTDNIKTGLNQFALIKNQAGNRFPTQATHLLVNVMEQFTVIELLESKLLAWELSNTVNSVTRAQPLGVILNNYIDHTGKGDTYSPWFLLDKTIDRAGAIYQYRGGMNIETEVDFKTKDYQATVEEEFAVAFVSPGYGVVASQNA
jgi:phage major head subunit gpT-like protein